MSNDLVYVVHPESTVAAKLRGGLQEADYNVVAMSSVDDAQSVTSRHQFTLPDAILTPLGDKWGGDNILVTLFESNPLMEQIPLVVVADEDKEDRRRALRMGLLSVVFPPYDGEEVVLTTKLAIERHRSEQLLFGSLEQLSVPDLLQTAEAGRRTGTVTFQHDGSKGTVWLKDGFVIDAEVEGESAGEEAVYQIAVWSTGTFEADFGELEIEERFRIPPSTLLLEAMRRFDEESATGITIPPIEEPEQEQEQGQAEAVVTDHAFLDLSLAVLNVVGSYALNHLHPTLIRQRFEEIRSELEGDHPLLSIFNVTEEGAVTVLDADLDEIDQDRLVRSVAQWVEAIFRRLDESLAWRFSSNRLARLLTPWLDQLDEFNFSEFIGLDQTVEETEEEAQGSDSLLDSPVPVGCLVLDEDGVVQTVSIYGPRVGRVEPGYVRGKNIGEILPPEIALLAERLMDRLDSGARELEGVAIGREVIGCGHQEYLLRLAIVRQPSGHGNIVTINRLRDQRRSLSPEIERDPLTGSLRDGKADRLLVANEDFLHAFEGLFARSLMHRHHELLQRFGKKWGLRHAMRLEQVVQRDYRKTLREMESQMALELLSASVGVFGLGSFEADLSYRDSGLVVIRHHTSPFPGIFAATAGGACPILSGFHAAILSYLAGRQLAAREVHCSREPGKACLFVVATEDRLTKLLIATPGSADHELLTKIVATENGGADR
jgi:DNA-binding response OmpR family regulator/predicted hydrocarbon binding protein